MEAFKIGPKNTPQKVANTIKFDIEKLTTIQNNVPLYIQNRMASQFFRFSKRSFHPTGGGAPCLWALLFVLLIFYTLYILRETELPKGQYCTNKTERRLMLMQKYFLFHSHSENFSKKAKPIRSKCF